MSPMPKPLPSGLPAALVRRTAGAAALVLALGGAFAAGRAFGGSDLRTDPPVQLTAQGLGTGRSCADLRSWYVAHGLDQVTAWGWHGPVLYDAMGGAPSATLPMAGSPRTDSSAPAPEARLDTTTGSATGTNVQVAAVDEPDVVKASGALLVRVVDDVLVVYDVSGHRPRRVGTAPLLGMTNTHLLLVGSRVVAIGEDAIAPRADSFYGYGMSSAGTRVRTFDLSDPTRPTEVDNRSYDASLVTARQTGDVVRLVLSTPPPSLDFVQPQDGRTDKEALEANRDLVRSSTIDDWLPTVTVEGGTAHSLVACSDVAVPTTYGGLGTMAVVGFDPASPDAVDPSAVATGSDVAMMSTGHLYVAAAPSRPYPWSGGVMTPDLPVTNGASAKTTIYAFDLTGTSASYVGAGTVDGAVASSWSMDEWQGVLRVAVQAAYGGSATSVVLLRPRDGALTRVAALDGLGAGQQLKSVRWLDGLAIVVTFQQVDPFYALDLSDPAHPHVLGVLHLPGWSSYLHPVESHLVLGLGQTAPGTFISPEVRIPPPAPPKPIPTPVEPAPRDLGPNDAVPGSAGTIEPQPVDPRIVTRPFFPHAKATVFDLRDLTHPRATATVDYPVGSTALAGLDPHQVSWLPDRHILLTIVSDGYSGRGWLSVLTVGQHSLDNRMVRLAPVADLGSVRTVPLADGRVVLVDGDHVRFVRV
jgi:hypothetical protein